MLFLRNTQTVTGTGGTTYDLDLVQGTAATLVSASISPTSFTKVFEFRREIASEFPQPTLPTSVVITAVSASTLETRWRAVQIRGGTVLAASDYGAIRNAVGTFTDTLTLDTTWQAGDFLALEVELRRTTGGGSRTVTLGVNRAGSFVDATFVTPPSAVTGTGAANAPPLALAQPVASASGAFSAGAATDIVAYSNSLLWHLRSPPQSIDIDSFVFNWVERFGPPGTFRELTGPSFAMRWAFEPTLENNFNRFATSDTTKLVIDSWADCLGVNNVLYVPDNFDGFTRGDPSTVGVEGQQIVGTSSYTALMVNSLDTWTTEAPNSNRVFWVYAGLRNGTDGSLPDNPALATPTQITNWLNLCLSTNPAEYGPWCDQLVAQVKAARPSADVRLMDINRIFARTYLNTPVGTVDWPVIIEDAAPHGFASLYIILGAITYTYLFGERPDINFVPDPGANVDPAITNNWAEIVDFIYDEVHASTGTAIAPPLLLGHPVADGAGAFAAGGGGGSGPVVSSVTGATVTSINEGGVDYDVYTFTSGGSITFSSGGDVEYLIVAGGGGGGAAGANSFESVGGGGAGGMLPNTGTPGTFAATASSYTIAVGTGGAGGTTTVQGGNGGNSSISGAGAPAVAIGGGAGGSQNAYFLGLSGGSGGGQGGPVGAIPAGTAGQGNDGERAQDPGGGGGGAGQAGGANGQGRGGDGVTNAITGTAVSYAGGGSGTAVWSGAPNLVGGVGGGGESRGNATGQAGAANTGGGGGAGAVTGGAGGDGVVILRVPTSGGGDPGPGPDPVSGTGEAIAPTLLLSDPVAGGAGAFSAGGGGGGGGGPTVTSVTGATAVPITVDGIDYDVYTFTSGGSITFSSGGEVDHLIVAGGGAGGWGRFGYCGGGGGAGGLLAGTALITPGTFAVAVGAGGAPPASDGLAGGNGGNSSALGLTAIGGGGGGGGPWTPAGNGNGQNGGSGGGGSSGGDTESSPGTAGTGTAGQGNAGGVLGTGNAAFTAGGGGGAGGVGQNGSPGSFPDYGGHGGVGVSSDITGTVTAYAGGGGAGRYALGQAGGGNGADVGGTAGAGAANTGSGGGGGRNVVGGAGGSGVVILRVQTSGGTDPEPDPVTGTGAAIAPTLNLAQPVVSGVGSQLVARRLPRHTFWF
jgi:hypothetical protein